MRTIGALAACLVTLAGCENVRTNQVYRLVNIPPTLENGGVGVLEEWEYAGAWDEEGQECEVVGVQWSPSLIQQLAGVAGIAEAALIGEGLSDIDNSTSVEQSGGGATNENVNAANAKSFGGTQIQMQEQSQAQKAVVKGGKKGATVMP